MTGHGAPITRLTTAVYRFPTPEPEADGTLTAVGTVQATVQRKRGVSRAVLGDFNADGKPDIAGITFGRARLAVILNTSTP